MHLWVKELSLFIFTLALKQNFPPRSFHHPSPRQKEITHFPQEAFFENLLSPPAETGDYKRAEKITKIKHVRLLFSSFDISHHLCIFPFLVYVGSSMLEWEGSLTQIIQFSLKIAVCKNNCMKDKNLP